jgi:hypothetical protein
VARAVSVADIAVTLRAFGPSVRRRRRRRGGGR